VDAFFYGFARYPPCPQTQLMIPHWYLLKVEKIVHAFDQRDETGHEDGDERVASADNAFTST
jgi:hypothetical protein